VCKQNQTEEKKSFEDYSLYFIARWLRAPLSLGCGVVGNPWDVVLLNAIVEYCS
jgi:hypothetical protein